MGGTPPRFLIIDDGWQEIENKSKDSDCVVQEGAQYDPLFLCFPHVPVDAFKPKENC